MKFGKVLRKVFDVASVLLIGVLAPITVGVLISANALPGQTTYPLKLSLENMAVFVSQVHEPTEMELRLAVLDRRYQEARTLLEDEGSPRGYEHFADAAQATQRAVLGLKDSELQEYYREELAEDLGRYQRRLEVLIEELR